MNNITKWKQRVNVMQMIYTFLLSPYCKDKFLEDCINLFHFNADQLRVVEFFLENHNKIIEELNDSVKQTWRFDSLNYVDQAILLTAICEYRVLKTERNILINESVKTAKNFSGEEQYKFINAVLDKVLN